MSAFEPIDWTIYAPAPIIGVDEVGRGCLAGPVYAGAVILQDNLLTPHLTDSKLLSEKRREELSKLIKEQHIYGIGLATPEEIDELNILQASLLAMKRAVEAVWQKLVETSGKDFTNQGHLLIDGKFRIPDVKARQTTFIKGDLRVAPISAASIVAKVARDHLMQEMSVEYPQYGFEKHKGYSTVLHKTSIATHGPCEHHRKSFAGVKEYV